MAPSLSEQAQALFHIDLTPMQAAQFETYSEELRAWNEHVNLTAITEPSAVQTRHFLDSLSIVKAASMTPGIHIIDVGTGAGFPGLPLAIAYPQIRMVLLESTGKKVNFLKHVVDKLSLNNIQFVHARAEEAGQMPEHRAQYDVVLARAVARMPILLEYLLPLADIGGVCIAMKGKTAHQEAQDSNRALSTLGGQLHSIETIMLPDVDDEHYLVVVRKTADTPGIYPRKPGTPAQKPLV